MNSARSVVIIIIITLFIGTCTVSYTMGVNHLYNVELIDAIKGVYFWFPSCLRVTLVQLKSAMVGCQNALIRSLHWSKVYFWAPVSNLSCRVKELRKLVFVESMEQDTDLRCVRSWRRSRLVSMERNLVLIRLWWHSYTCAFCGKNTVKRTCVGIWECKKCKKVVAGGAWSISTPTALTVRSSIQRLRRSKNEA